MSGKPKGTAIVRLKGGLGNQMFQYACAYSLARRNGLALALDHVSGFSRDSAYGRSYELDRFPIEGRRATPAERLPFLCERLQQRLTRSVTSGIRPRPWGTYVSEGDPRFHEEVVTANFRGKVWLEGFWQTERYFREHVRDIARQFSTDAPTDPAFSAMARRIQSCKAVAVGVRMYEEAPGGAGFWASPYAAYEAGARKLHSSPEDRTFFVFCTRRTLVEGRLTLPGPMVMVTGDDGYGDALASLWLMQQCQEFIISNSSFYWWASWLAQAANPQTRVVAIDNFPHRDAIPERWISVPRGT